MFAAKHLADWLSNKTESEIEERYIRSGCTACSSRCAVQRVPVGRERD